MDASTEPIVTYVENRLMEGWTNPDGSHLTWQTLLSADRDGATPLCAGVTTMPVSEESLALHRHPDAELYFVISGHGTLFIEGKGYPLKPSAVAFIPGNAWHRVSNPGPEVISLFYMFPTASFPEVVYEYPPDVTPSVWDTPS